MLISKRVRPLKGCRAGVRPVAGVCAFAGTLAI
jgi:hypothetical protein